MITPTAVTAASKPTTLAPKAGKPVRRKPTKAKTATKAKPATTGKAKPRRAAKRTKAPNAGTPHKLTGKLAFEARPWLDPQAVKARFATNTKLDKVYAALGPKGSAAKTLEQLAERAFGNKPSVAKARSWVRNQMRFLRDSKLAKRVEAGTYQKVG